MPLQTHPTGNYSFVPGIAPYSCGVVSNPGFEVVHVALPKLIPWQAGFRLMESYLASEQRPKAALCAISLRSPKPFTFPGFADFNSQYAAVLKSWDVFVESLNPIARTNVVPQSHAPSEPSLAGFAFTRPSPGNQPATFVVAGAGELPEGVLNREGIVDRGDITSDAMARKAAFVMDLMENRLQQLQTNWTSVTRTNVYTVHPLEEIVSKILVPQIGPAALHGITWHYSRPPIEEIEFEMDVRGIRTERCLS